MFIALGTSTNSLKASYLLLKDSSEQRLESLGSNSKKTRVELEVRRHLQGEIKMGKAQWLPQHRAAARSYYSLPSRHKLLHISLP